MSAVIHIKDAPGNWKEVGSAYIYIGRGRGAHNNPANCEGPYVPGYWGNPFRVGEGKRGLATTLRQYEEYLLDRIDSDEEFAKSLNGHLAFKTLVCFCAPNPCHGHVLRYYLGYIEDGMSVYNLRNVPRYTEQMKEQ